MEGTKLTSIRLEQKTSDKIDEIVKDLTYYTRSDVINNILRCVLFKFTEGQIREMVNRYRWYNNKCLTQFEVTNELESLKRD